MKIMVTAAEIKTDIRDEFLCPMEFIRHLSRWGVIRQLKSVYNADEFDRDERDQILDEIRDDYKDYCHDAGLEYGEDNRRKHPHFFYYERLR